MLRELIYLEDGYTIKIRKHNSMRIIHDNCGRGITLKTRPIDNRPFVFNEFCASCGEARSKKMMVTLEMLSWILPEDS